MTAQATIVKAKFAGLKLWPGDSGGLGYSGDKKAFDRLRPELIANKAEILRALNCDAWLMASLNSIKPAAMLLTEAALLGYSAADIDAAVLRIGGVRSQCLGAEYLRLPDRIDRGAVRDTLERFAAELGFEWRELLGVGLIQDCDLDQFAQDWHTTTPAQWRAFVASVGTRARHRCTGIAHRIACDCGGVCRAFQGAL